MKFSDDSKILAVVTAAPENKIIVLDI